MKKYTLLALVLVASASFCQAQTYKADIKTDVDSISYAIGQLNGGQLQMFLEQQGMDSTYIDDFIKGFNEGAKYVGDKKKQAYSIGLMQGMQMTEGLNASIFGDKEGDEKISIPNFIAGLIAGVNNDNSIFDPEDIQGKLDEMVSAVHEKAMAKKYKEEKEAGEKFLAENAKKRGVKTLPSGVQYKVIKKGKGDLPGPEDNVRINYEGRLIDGTVFDSSYERNEPTEMAINMVVPGFAEALKNMPVGSTWEVYIPAEQAYAERELDKIKPFSTLIFKIELLEIVESVDEDDYIDDEKQ